MDINVNVTIHLAPKQERLGYLRWTIGPIQEQEISGPPVGALHVTPLTDSQFVEGTITIVNKKGNPAPVQDGSATLISSDPSAVEVTLTGSNPYAVKFTAKAGGASRVTFSADADLGDGVRLIEGFEDVTVTAGGATGLKFEMGTPQEQPEA